MVLTERGINVSNMCRDQMVSVLSEHDDFANEKSSVQLYLESRGYYCLFIPKYHCELNPIERVWGMRRSILGQIVIIQLLAYVKL